jgi:hypothetical protein
MGILEMSPFVRKGIRDHRFWLLTLVWVGWMVGCSRKSGEFELHSVTGQVVWAGKPLIGAEVTLHPIKATPTEILKATSEEEGRFTLKTNHTKEGAPEGEYAVTVHLWSVNRGKGETDSQIVNRLPVKYSNPQTTPFHISVRPGSNELKPFELKK